MLGRADRPSCKEMDEPSCRKGWRWTVSDIECRTSAPNSIDPRSMFTAFEKSVTPRTQSHLVPGKAGPVVGAPFLSHQQLQPIRLFVLVT